MNYFLLTPFIEPHGYVYLKSLSKWVPYHASGKSKTKEGNILISGECV